MIKDLLLRGARRDIVDNEEKKPIDYAGVNKELIRILVSWNRYNLI